MAAESAASNIRLALIAVASIVAIYTVNTIYQSPRPRSAKKGLRRSNAVRRPHREHILGSTIEINVATDTNPLGSIRVRTDAGVVFFVALGDDKIPSSQRLCQILSISERTANQLRQQIIRSSVNIILDACNNRVEITDTTSHIFLLRENIMAALAGDGSDPNASLAMIMGVDNEDVLDSLPSEVNETKSANDTGLDATTHELKKLLYAISEDQAKRQAYQHRGIACEGCHEHPIHGIRWHCLNCADYDLCSACKVVTGHPRNHIFAEIKIPIPTFAQPLSGHASWYNPDAIVGQRHGIAPVKRRKYAQDYHWEEAEIDALFDQFICLADEYNPSGKPYISEFAFVRALGADRWRDRPRPIIIFERMFAFYDTDGTNTITFDKFVSGVSYLRGKERFRPIRRALVGFDLRGDGLISKQDFLFLLQAKFDLHRCLIEEIVDCETFEDMKIANDFIHSTQPISSAFKGDIPASTERASNRKHENTFGDFVPDAGVQVIAELGESSDERSGFGPINKSTNFPDSLTVQEREWLGLMETKSTKQESDRRIDQQLLWHSVRAAMEKVIESPFTEVERRHQSHLHEAAMNAQYDEWTTTCARACRLASSMDEASVLELDTELQFMRHKPMQVIMSYLDKALDTAEKDRAREEQEATKESNSIAAIGTTATEIATDHEPRLTDKTNLSNEPAPDPTLPQNRPNATRLEDCSPTTHGMSMDERTSEADSQDAAKHSLFQSLKLLQDKIPAQESRSPQPRIRDGHPCLTLEEIEEMLDKPESQDLRVMVTSWLEWASF